MTVKTKLFIIVAVLIAAGAVSVRVSNPSARTPLLSESLYVDPDSTWKAEGEVFQIGIRVSGGVTNLMGYNVAVTFDSSVIEILDVARGSLFDEAADTTFFWWFDAGVKTDSVRVNGAALGTTVDGPGELFALKFKALTHGVVRTTVVHIAYSDLRDGVNHPIAHEMRDGFVAVEPTVRAEQSTWGAVKERYR